MSPLGEPITYNDLPISYLSFIPGSIIIKYLAWYELAPDTKRGYAAVINSYNSFCMLYNKKLLSASMIMLEKWATIRIYRSMPSKQGQIKPDNVISFFSAFKSYYIDLHFNLKDFNNFCMALIIKRERKLFFSPKRNCLPITKEIFQNVIKDRSQWVTNLKLI